MRTIKLLGAAALALAGCGSSGSPKTPSRVPPKTESRVPEVLQGRWQTTIESARITDRPARLTKRDSVWKLRLLGTDGEGDGPSMVLSNEQLGKIVYPISLSGNEITLRSDSHCTRFEYVEIDTENLQIHTTEPEGCPSTLVSTVLQRQWRLVERGPSTLDPTTAEGSLASREAFVSCARRHAELGVVVGFRDGWAVPEPGQDVGAGEINTRVSAPKAIAEVLGDGGQYVGLRGGAGPDVDVVFYGHLPGTSENEVYTPMTRFFDEAKGILSSGYGDYSRLAGSQEWATARLGGGQGWDEDFSGGRVPRALKHLVPCFRRAVRATDRLVPAPGPVAGTWRTDPITVDDMSRTLREHGLAQWIGPFAKQAPIGETPTALVLEIDTRDYVYPHDWHLYAEPGPGPREKVIDYRMQDVGGRGLQYEQDGDQLVVSYDGEANTYRWSVDGEYLTLTWQKTTYPPHMGIPEEVFQRALYMTAKFKRVRDGWRY